MVCNSIELFVHIIYVVWVVSVCMKLLDCQMHWSEKVIRKNQYHQMSENYLEE